MTKESLKGNKGFTLIEIAIVVAIIGLLVAAGTRMIGPLTKRAKYTEGKEIIGAAVDSVLGYGATNGSLPNFTQFQNSVRTTTDAWGKNLTYIWDNNLETGICGRKTTSIAVRECDDAACSTSVTISNVAFVITSGGGNYNTQTGSGTLINIYDPGTPGIDNYAADMTRAEAYDDIVKWITLTELRMKTGCLGPQLKIVNTILPFGNHGTLYNAEVFAEGGVPFTGGGGRYRWCVQTASGLLPGWITLNPAATPISAD